MSVPFVPLIPLILAGGKSRRMGYPKHLLQLPDGTPFYKHLWNLLRQTCPDASTIYISLAQDSPLDAFLHNLAATCEYLDTASLAIIRDLETNNSSESGGPAQGLLSAFRSNPTATWLVVAIDYPLLTANALQRLRDVYTPPVTCFRNSEGYPEPLIGVWSPEALGRLAENVRSGKSSGPCAVVRELGGFQVDITTEESACLTNVNTQRDWDQVLRIIVAREPDQCVFHEEERTMRLGS